MRTDRQMLISRLDRPRDHEQAGELVREVVQWCQEPHEFYDADHVVQIRLGQLVDSLLTSWGQLVVIEAICEFHMLLSPHAYIYMLLDIMKRCGQDGDVRHAVADALLQLVEHATDKVW